MRWSYDPHSYELRREACQILAFDGILTRDLALPVWCFNQRSSEATHGGSWSFERNDMYEMNHCVLSFSCLEYRIGVSKLVEV